MRARTCGPTCTKCLLTEKKDAADSLLKLQRALNPDATLFMKEILSYFFFGVPLVLMAGQPTPPNVPHTPEIAGLMIRACENHWFPLIRPAIKPGHLKGVSGWGRGRLTRQEVCCRCLLEFVNSRVARCMHPFWTDRG